jgi:hypothetical protein
MFVFVALFYIVGKKGCALVGWTLYQKLEYDIITMILCLCSLLLYAIANGQISANRLGDALGIAIA